MTWEFVLFLLAVICEAIAVLIAFFPPRPDGAVARVPWLPLGLVFFFLVFCLQAAPKH
jgi:hypothetical protein